MKAKIDYSIYLVTDAACCKGRPLLECVDSALKGGVTLVQYRLKNGDGGRMYEEAFKIKTLCDKYSVPLIINDRLDIAMAVGAAGVHLGQDDLPCSIARVLLGDEYVIGVSAHDQQEALKAVQAGADYLGCGAVFGSATKTNVSKLGLENLEVIRKAVDIPIVGIGGVNSSNYALVRQIGADGAAIISGILSADDIEAEVRKFKI